MGDFKHIILKERLELDEQLSDEDAISIALTLLNSTVSLGDYIMLKLRVSILSSVKGLQHPATWTTLFDCTGKGKWKLKQQEGDPWMNSRTSLH